MDGDEVVAKVDGTEETPVGSSVLLDAEAPSMTKKLYLVECRGMVSAMTGTAHGQAYVVATTAEEAYQTLRLDLDHRGLGFSHERELRRVSLVAESKVYPDCRVMLYGV